MSGATAFLALALFFSGPLSLLSLCASERETINIGVLLPPEEPQLRSVREGILLAQDQANQGTNGPVHVSIRGRVGQWGADAVEAARLVTDEGAEGLIAPPDGSASHLVLQVSGRTTIPVITLCPDGSVGLTGVPWVLRMVPRTEDEAAAIFRDAFPSRPGHTPCWTALVPPQRAGREIVRDIRKAALLYDCILDRVLEVSSPTNANSIVARILTNRPDGILIWLPPLSAGTIVNKLRVAGYAGVLAGTGRLQCSEFFSAAGISVEGFIVPGIVASREDIARSGLFEGAFGQKWDHPPDLTAKMSFDAAMVLIYLLRRQEFRTPSHHPQPGFLWQGASGEMSFDTQGNRQVKLELLRASDGRFINGHKLN